MIDLLVKKDTNHVWKQSNNWIQEVGLGRKPNCFREIGLSNNRKLVFFKNYMFKRSAKATS